MASIIWGSLLVTHVILVSGACRRVVPRRGLNTTSAGTAGAGGWVDRVPRSLLLMAGLMFLADLLGKHPPKSSPAASRAPRPPGSEKRDFYIKFSLPRKWVLVRNRSSSLHYRCFPQVIFRKLMILSTYLDAVYNSGGVPGLPGTIDDEIDPPNIVFLINSNEGHFFK